MIGEDVLFSGIREIGAHLRARRLSAVDLTEMSLRRLETIGPRLGAVVTVTRERALSQAHRANQELLAGRDRGPLHGIPYGAKDLLATKGIPTTWGAEPLRDQVFDHDATVVERLEEAGAVLVAKLAMVELAGGLGYNNPDASFTGPGRTPWNPAHWSGGSSSGSAAAVAAGLVRLRDGQRDVGLDPHPRGLLRGDRAAADLRPRLPPRGDGPLLDARQARPPRAQRRRLRPRALRDRRPRPAGPDDRRELPVPGEAREAGPPGPALPGRGPPPRHRRGRPRRRGALRGGPVRPAGRGRPRGGRPVPGPALPGGGGDDRGRGGRRGVPGPHRERKGEAAPGRGRPRGRLRDDDDAGRGLPRRHAVPGRHARRARPPPLALRRPRRPDARGARPADRARPRRARAGGAAAGRRTRLARRPPSPPGTWPDFPRSPCRWASAGTGCRPRCSSSAGRSPRRLCWRSPSPTRR